MRRVDEWIEVINFQTAMWGGSFAVNIGLQPIFAPTTHHSLYDWKKIDIVDSIFTGRLGPFLTGLEDQWHSFGADRCARCDFSGSVWQTLLRFLSDTAPHRANCST